MRLYNLLTMAILMIVGEVVFILPFVIVRIFRPTFLAVFKLTNLELGTAFSAYGVVAMVAYVIGGPIADRFSSRKLIPFALVITSLGGFWLYTIPSVMSLILLYGLWGASTILLFWSSFVKAQRQLGLHTGQGKAFGLVDAGRGALAAVMAIASVFLLEWFVGNNAETASEQEFQIAMQNIVLIFTGITLVSAVLAYLFIEEDQKSSSSQRISLAGIQKVIKQPTVWMHAIIVMCAYVGYKCTDDFSLYATDVLHYNDIDSARLAAITFWSRPLSAIIGGMIADKWLTSKTVAVFFTIMIAGSLLISSGLFVNETSIIVITLTTTSVAIYGIRGIYYALFEESNVSMAITGSAAGLVSVIGYTPDVFMGPLMGVILDNNSGALGHQYLFLVFAGFSTLGLLVALGFIRSVR